MQKEFMVVLGAVLMLVSVNVMAADQTTGTMTKKMTTMTEKKMVETANKMCPMDGYVIDAKDAVKVEYKGKSYNFCSKACATAFKKDPEKALKALDQKSKDMKKAVGDAKASSMMNK